MPLRTWVRLRLALVIPATGTLGFRGGIAYSTGATDAYLDNVACDTQ
jgi:hypothetical protein